MRSGAKGLTGALTLAALLLGGGVAQAQGPVLEDGKTKAVYDYTKAIRERVFIPQPGIDQDGRTATTSSRSTSCGRSRARRRTRCRRSSIRARTTRRSAAAPRASAWPTGTTTGVNDRWPLFYDNYFVPRGYAYILSQGNGTGYTEHGCPMHGGPGDIAGHKSVVDWLNGRVKAYAQLPGRWPATRRRQT